MRESRALDKELQTLDKEFRGLHETGTTPPANVVGGIGNSKSSPARVIVMLARAGGTMVSEEAVDVADVTDIFDPADMVDEVEVAVEGGR